MASNIITLIGGTGFLGRYAVKLLAKSGYTLRVVSRHPAAALPLKTAGDVGQIVPVAGDIARPESLEGKLEGSHAVINLAGILFEGGSQRFTAVHAQGAERLAQMAKAAGVPYFIHLSALGVDKAAGSHYARSKMLGEKAVLAAFPQATLLRPGIMFGDEDNFFNQFADMARKLPFLPLIGGGQTRFQPVYVGDVARVISACLTKPQTQGQIYELGGPQVYTFKEILEYILHTLGAKRPLIPLPSSVASMLGLGYEIRHRLLFMPPKLTRDQVTLLQYDNIVTQKPDGFVQLGLTPMPVELVVPEYLARYHRKPLTSIGTTYA